MWWWSNRWNLGRKPKGSEWCEAGLAADDEVIINGIVNARPGSKVSPQEGDMSQFTTNQLQLQTNAQDRTGR